MPTGDTGRSGSDGPANALPGDRAASSAKANRGPAIAKGLEEVVKLVEPKPDLGLRDREASDVAAQLLRSEPVIAAITGDPGTGRTALLGAIAARLDALEEPVPVWRIGPDTAGSSPTGTMRSVMATTKEPAVIVLDDLDEMADLGTDNVNRGLLSVISEARFHRNLRILVVLNRRYLSRLKVVAQSLGDALEITPLPELPPEAVEEIVKTRGDELAARFGLAMDGETVAAATAPRVGSNGPAQPGLGISRLDLAVARCHLLGDRTVDVKHLSPTLIDSPIRHEAEALATALGDRVKGQPEAIIRVADRLTITRAHLDLRPDRPNGVFLFIGPTGVGKTHLARELAVHEFGGADRLIRLDMSEYYDDWALSRIVGPAPGFVGSTEPESWLTTKVAAMPRSVVLLDEIEKAHPRVWNIFLQVFDAGRLTDSRGTVADFSESVVIMTSNLGLQEAKNQAVGFGAKIGAGAVDADRLMSIVKERMAPELINRLDDIVVFEALSPQAIEEIATTELNAARTRLTASGWAVHWDNEVTQWLATNGYDPAYGARHLQRNIEHEFIGLLSRAKTREVHFHVVDGKLVAESA
jgi:ATP-dependent Clp protease ATP-binding subunit ClpC